MLVRNLITNRTICLGSLTRAVASLAITVNSSICLASLARAVASLARTVLICSGQEALYVLKPFFSPLESR